MNEPVVLMFETPKDLFQAIDDSLDDACMTDQIPYQRELLKEVSRIHQTYLNITGFFSNLDVSVFIREDLTPILKRYEDAAARLRSRLEN